MMNNFKRFFIEFSYIGAKFSGVAKQLNDVLTVHNVIENNLKNILKTKTNLLIELKSNIQISSRTDAGVHALANTAHFDLEINQDQISDIEICKYIKDYLNKKFIQNNIFVRILNCQRVNSNFVARHAKSRTYLYRLALSNDAPIYWRELERIKKVEKCLNNTDNSISYLFPFNNFSNIIDSYYVTELIEPFNKDLFIKALDKYNGVYDFSAFTTKRGREEMLEQKRNPVKNVEINVNLNGKQFLSDYMPSFNENYNLIDVEITAGSFLYKMIRKLIGAAYDVARGTIPIEQIEEMLKTPCLYYDSKLTTIMKPNGLYLKSVEYDKNDLVFSDK